MQSTERKFVFLHKLLSVVRTYSAHSAETRGGWTQRRPSIKTFNQMYLMKIHRKRLHHRSSTSDDIVERDWFGYDPQSPYLSLDADRVTVHRTLNALKNPGERNDIDDTILMRLPCLSLKCGRGEQFVAAIKQWFKRTRPIFDSNTFDAGQVLYCLGTLNRLYNGRVSREFDGKPPIRYLLRRMTLIGINRYPPSCILDALTGVRQLTNGATKPDVPDRSWMAELASHLERLAIEETDDRHLYVVRRSATILLKLSTLRDAWRNDERHRLRRILCLLAKQSLERLRPNGGDARLDHGLFMGILHYADAFLISRINPDKIVAGSWQRWFEQCNPGIEYCADNTSLRHLTLGYLIRVLEVAVQFDRVDLFWQSAFVNWKRTAERVIDFCRKCRPEDRRKAAAFIYGVGKLARASRRRPDRAAFQLLFLRSIIEQLLVDADNSWTAESHIYALIGVRLYATSIDAPVRLPDEYLRTLCNWCDRKRQEISSSSDETASKVATILRSLNGVEPERAVSVLRSFSDLFWYEIDRVSAQNMTRTLACYGQACSNFGYDPASDIPSRNVWPAYFDKAKQCFERNTHSATASERERGQVADLIRSVTDVAYVFKRVDDFYTIRDSFSERLCEFFLVNPTRTDTLSMAKRLLDLHETYKIQFNDKLLFNLTKLVYSSSDRPVSKSTTHVVQNYPRNKINRPFLSCR